ncbi:MAG: polymerase sigma factor, sigma-70 family [Acidobacteria bacterium]|nr:polymerase sigma factor, sigma-70 family [Acidobacteriota bacterium]
MALSGPQAAVSDRFMRISVNVTRGEFPQSAFTVYPLQTPLMDPERLLVEHLPEVERTIAFICRRHHLRDADAEDFGQFVNLKLIEHDYAILRKFEGRSELRTFLSVVVHRLLLDFRNHLLGKWRPSAEAKRLGARAVALETLLHRDRRPMDEALQTMQSAGGDTTDEELHQLAARLPKRPIRPRDIAIEEMPTEPASESDAERGVIDADRRQLADCVAAIVRKVIDTLPKEDRAILRMHFIEGMTVARIARALGVEQKPLYPRLLRHFAKIRRALDEASISQEDIEDLIGHTDVDFGLGRDNDGEGMSR